MLNITNHEGNATQAHNEGVPWQFSALRVCTPTAGGMDQSMVKELRSCMLLPAAKKMLQHHLIPVRMAITKKTTNNKCWQGCGEKEKLMYCWWECNLVQLL